MQLEDSDIKKRETVMQLLFSILDRNSNAERNSSEWKHYVKVGLQGHRARDEPDLQERIRAFELVPGHAAAYCFHVANNCVSFIDGVRIFDN